MFRTLWHPAAIRVGVWCADAPRLKIDDSREKLVALHQWVSSEEMGREDVWRHVKRQQMKSQQHEKGREHQKRKGEERQLVGAAFGRLAETLCTGGVPQHPGSRSQALKGPAAKPAGSAMHAMRASSAMHAMASWALLNRRLKGRTWSIQDHLGVCRDQRAFPSPRLSGPSRRCPSRPPCGKGSLSRSRGVGQAELPSAVRPARLTFRVPSRLL
mmetsp:Transcript_37751/g.85690  ORF Transcript_37751/g.85690 Transcript_37751/m.85690 type:complete len:214 (-) Transcript_37751:222-863(-)